MMEQTMNYVKPELIVVAVVLYFIGTGLKQSQTVKDKYIPLILGGIGIVLCAVWVIALLWSSFFVTLRPNFHYRSYTLP